jgi:hypothetical protein
MKKRLRKIALASGRLQVRKSSGSNADKFPLRLDFSMRDREFAAGKCGLRIAQSGSAEIESQFQFRANEKEEKPNDSRYGSEKRLGARGRS